METYTDWLPLIEEYRESLVTDREEGRKIKERGAAQEEAAISSLEALSLLENRLRELRDVKSYGEDASVEEDEGDAPSIKEMIESAIDVRKIAASLGVDMSTPLTHEEVYSRLLKRLSDRPGFRSTGEILKEFIEVGYDVSRNQIRGAIQRGLDERTLIKLSYTSSRRYVWYGLPEWTVGEGDDRDFSSFECVPGRVLTLSEQAPIFSFE